MVIEKGNNVLEGCMEELMQGISKLIALLQIWETLHVGSDAGFSI